AGFRSAQCGLRRIAVFRFTMSNSPAQSHAVGWVERALRARPNIARPARGVGSRCARPNLRFVFLSVSSVRYLILFFSFLLGSVRRSTSFLSTPRGGGERRRAHECRRGTRICAP